jgi:hypothetical protein
MKKLSLLGLAVGVCLASPAMALEHKVVIEHPEGPIAADYAGTVNVETRQTGSVAAPGRQSTLRCEWSASLSVDRTAQVGETLKTRREMRQDDVASGSTPGWCRTNAKAIDKLVDARKETFRSAMLELVAQDRTALLAEAGQGAGAGRDS